MTVEVVTVCDKKPTQPYYHYDEFLASLMRYGTVLTVLGFGQGWEGLVTKPKRLRHHLRYGCKADIVIACDCWDVVFQKHPDEIAERYQTLWPSLPVVFNAERNLFPRTDLEAFFPETGTPWRYLNSGFMIGRRDDLLTMIETVDWDAIPPDHQLAEDTDITYAGVTRRYEKDSWFCPNDQGDYQEIFSKQPVPMTLDVSAELCITGHGASLEEFDLSEPEEVRNTITDTVPGVFHFNGDAKEKVLPPLFRHWGL